MESLQLAVLNLDFDSSQEKSTQAMASMLESSGSSELMSTMPWLRAKLSRCAKLMWVDFHEIPPLYFVLLVSPPFSKSRHSAQFDGLKAGEWNIYFHTGEWKRACGLLFFATRARS